ncbi:MAG TPA: TetR/AcrR family transcriptional regulator [Candidatus Aminicenantes bacterium]|nr:TetR/AcrR family transcriptional regulator [Candidatus Aminicenantes bacterium]
MAASDAPQRILDAARREFADHGFSGARMDVIARGSGVNKALPFYYFRSKEKLYEEVVTGVMGEFLRIIRPILTSDLTPRTLVEQFPRVIIDFFSNNRDFLRIVGRELLDGSARAPELMARLMRNEPHGGPVFFAHEIEQWYREGLIREQDPVQFMLHLFSLCIYSILARPMVEMAFQVRNQSDKEFYEKRIRGVTAVLKEGILT